MLFTELNLNLAVQRPTTLLLLQLLITLSVISISNGREIHANVQNTLQCYQCIIEGTDETVCDKDLLTCPNTQAYDRCMINTKRNATTGQVTIIKGCALAPCEFEKEIESIIFSGKCDLNRRGADCVRCCVGDGCNKRSLAPVQHSIFGPLFLFPIILLLQPCFSSSPYIYDQKNAL